MRIDRVLLRGGYVASVVIGIVAYLMGLNAIDALAVAVVLLIVTRLSIYIYYERYLGFRSFDDFKTGKIKHECVACGASCHLRVSLGKDDVERILQYAKQTGMAETIIERRGQQSWLKRRSDGACVFLKYEGKLPRCSIYDIRPTACRLYPLIPTGARLRVDPLCPGLSRTQGHTFKEHLATQNVGSYVRKVLGKV
ncbi:MAG TPA: YkgJ family cysteine cluster protein [Terriglobales bacterium]|nr:YkgJ family cysteine cluster protein [Terriglobales bacterium]